MNRRQFLQTSTITGLLLLVGKPARDRGVTAVAIHQNMPDGWSGGAWSIGDGQSGNGWAIGSGSQNYKNYFPFIEVEEL